MRFRFKNLLLVAFSLIGLLSLQAQGKRLISGYVVDAKTKEGLPYVTISLKKLMIGIISNEEGKFDLYVPETAMGDTLLVSYLGYKHVLMDMSLISTPLIIKLEETVVELEEIIIRPTSPETYIRMAMRKVRVNYPASPFETQAYYREKLTENKTLIKSDEGIFKTYCKNYLDTLHPINQLLLFRRSTPNEVSFMSESKMGKAIRDTSHGRKEKKPGLISHLGGPGEILKSSDITKNAGAYLDSMKFKSYTYSFAKSSSYNTNELIVIHFATKGRVKNAREGGKIYIDATSLAIVKIENRGTYNFMALKSALFLLSIGLKDLTYEEESEFQQINGKWYPKNLQISLNFTLTNNHLFKKDENADFGIEQFFIVNKLNTTNPNSVPLEKQFDPNKEISTQVYNDHGIAWSEMNIIKK